MLDRQYMSDWQRHEETGEWPDAVFTPDEEFDCFDPEQQEIAALVVERYDQENRQKWERIYRNRISALEQALTESGIEIPEGN